MLLKQIKQSLSFLNKRDVSRLAIAICGQIVLALFDMAGAAGLGFIGVIAAVSISGSKLPKSIVNIENFFGVSGYSVTRQLAILGAIVTFLFLSKTLGSLYLNKRVLYFLSAKQVRIAGDIWKKVLRSDYLGVAAYPQQEMIQAITDSLNMSIIGILGNLLLAISELILLVFLISLLAIVYPSMALLTLITFGTLAYITQSKVGKKTRNLNAEYSAAAVASKTRLADALSVLREIRVLGRSSFFVDKFSADRTLAANAYVESLWLGQVPKYILEIGIVLCGIVVFFFTQLTSSSVDAIGRIVVFLAVSGRLVPSILRLQAEVIGMHANAGIAQTINNLRDKLEMMGSVEMKSPPESREAPIETELKEAIEIRLQNVSFSYLDREQEFVFGNLTIPRGRTIAIIGKSGIGKTTLVQMVLGLIQPAAGLITLNGKSPNEWIQSNIGSVSYLPQAVEIVSGDIAENIALGIPSNLVDVAKLRLALKIAALDDWVESLPLGMATIISEKGLNFSGGQLQRIGIARAVYDEPRLIVLDEPTSSLDEETEAAFLKMLSLLRGRTTFLMITHKLAMIDHVDEVLLLEEKGNKVTGRLLDRNSALAMTDKNYLET